MRKNLLKKRETIKRKIKQQRKKIDKQSHWGKILSGIGCQEKTIPFNIETTEIRNTEYSRSIKKLYQPKSLKS